jgi:uncharacterized repeat protein (TIGR04042 family)
MPEIQFKIQWPDGAEDLCYSPSLVVKDYFIPQHCYDLEDFVARSRTALTLASDRVQAKYGMPCGIALRQLAHIEATAAQYAQMPNSQVCFLEFLE